VSQFLSWSCYFCCEAFSSSLAWNLLALLAIPIYALNLVHYLGLSYLFLVIEFQMHLYSGGAESVCRVNWMAPWGSLGLGGRTEAKHTFCCPWLAFFPLDWHPSSLSGTESYMDKFNLYFVKKERYVWMYKWLQKVTK
jgi:hypothetical protein